MSSKVARLCGVAIAATLLISQNGRSQDRFPTYVGVGLGGHFEQQFPHADQKSNGRLAIHLSQYVQVAPKFSIGLSAMASGRMSALLGGAPPLDYYDQASNTVVINYNNLNAATYLIKNKYEWVRKDELVIYADVGVGISKYRYAHAAQSAFSLAPEVGLSMDSFQLAATFIWGGQTPSFTAVSGVPNSTTLTSIRSDRLYITLSYRIFKF